MLKNEIINLREILRKIQCEWEKIYIHYILFFCVTFLLMYTVGRLLHFVPFFHTWFSDLIAGIFNSFIFICLLAGLFRYFLNFWRRGKATWKTFWPGWKILGRMIGLGWGYFFLWIFSILILRFFKQWSGLDNIAAFLVVIACVFLLSYGLLLVYTCTLIADGQSILSSLRLSARMFQTGWKETLKGVVIALFIFSLGLLILGFGVLVTLPVSLLYFLQTYESLRLRVESNESSDIKIAPHET